MTTDTITAWDLMLDIGPLPHDIDNWTREDDGQVTLLRADGESLTYDLVYADEGQPEGFTYAIAGADGTQYEGGGDGVDTGDTTALTLAISDLIINWGEGDGRYA